jgi:hypothetical protein
MQRIENERLESTAGDETSGSAELSGIGRGPCYYSEINLRFLIFSCWILESSVDRGIPSFAAAPSGPATFPLLSAKTHWRFACSASQLEQAMDGLLQSSGRC